VHWDHGQSGLNQRPTAGVREEAAFPNRNVSNNIVDDVLFLVTADPSWSQRCAKVFDREFLNLAGKDLMYRLHLRL
jgi:hypothetical protein